MASTHDIRVQISVPVDAEKISGASALLSELSFGDRIAAAVKVLLLWLVAAIVCVAIPVLHFFLVPLAALIGLISFARQFKRTLRLVSGEFDCPVCKAKLEYDRSAFQWPKRQECVHCHAKLSIETIK